MKGLAALLGMLAWSIAMPTPVPLNDIDSEPNDDFAHAVHIKTPLTEASGCIDPASDVDFYTLTLNDSTPIFIGAKGKSSARFSVTLFNSKREPVSSGTDMVDLPSVDAGSYFVRLSGIEKACYDLQVFTETRLPPFG